MQADGAEPEEGQVDKGDMGGGGEGCTVQESCVRGKLKVRASTFSYVDTVNLNPFPVNPALVTHVTQE